MPIYLYYPHRDIAENHLLVKGLGIVAIAATAVFDALHYVNLYNAYMSADSGLANHEIEV